jgi:predicted alpha/beta-hydrolase family hydrolase
MQAWARRLRAIGEVVCFEYDYRAAGRRPPDRLPKLIRRHQAALTEATAHHSGPVVLVGKSMGSRVGCHLSLEAPVDAVVCFGYPLVGSSKKRPVRDDVLRALSTPTLFLQGDRDRMGPLDRFAVVRSQMTAPTALYVVEGGNHSLEVGVRSLRARGIDMDTVNAGILDAVQRFLTEHLPPTPGR